MGTKQLFSVQTRLFLLIAVFTWGLAAAFFLMQYTREREFKVQLLDARLQQVNNEVLALSDSTQSDARITSLATGEGLRISLIDRTGRVIFDTNKQNIGADHSDRTEVKQALQTGHGYTVRRISSTDENEYFYSATAGKKVIARSAVPYNHSLLQMLQADKKSSYFIIIIALLTTFVAWLAAHRISKAVKSLRDFANKAEFGDISNFDPKGLPDDELGEISKHIVNLYRIQKETAAQRDKNLRTAMNEQREKDRIKRRLTNNINHELKTPIQALQASLETLTTHADDIDEVTRAALLARSSENARRLADLVNDLSVLTRISEAPQHIERSDVDLGAVCRQVADELQLYPSNKHLRFDIELPENLLISGNERLIDSIFRNLMVNALNYSDGTMVRVAVESMTADDVTLTVEDDGVGVPEEHVDHLFERFYRVDSGRSRATGGTGLGLAIVKNAVQFHGGDIRVENRRGGGLKFTFTLKR